MAPIIAHVALSHTDPKFPIYLQSRPEHWAMPWAWTRWAMGQDHVMPASTASPSCRAGTAHRQAKAPLCCASLGPLLLHCSEESRRWRVWCYLAAGSCGGGRKHRRRPRKRAVAQWPHRYRGGGRLGGSGGDEALGVVEEGGNSEEEVGTRRPLRRSVGRPTDAKGMGALEVEPRPVGEATDVVGGRGRLPPSI